ESSDDRRRLKLCPVRSGRAHPSAGCGSGPASEAAPGGVAAETSPGAQAPVIWAAPVHIRAGARAGGRTVLDELAPEVRDELLGRWEPVYRSQLHYLVTWSTRGRRPVLKERHALALRTLVAQACEECGITLLECAIAPEHVHALIGLRPSQSVA